MVTEADTGISQVVLRDEASRRNGLSGFLRNARNRFGEYPRWSLVGIARTAMPDPTHRRQVPITTVAGVGDAEWTHCRPT